MNKKNLLINHKKTIIIFILFNLILVNLPLFSNIQIILPASASPDPPPINGGITEFNGDWYIDSADNLVYKNQTIILNGNLTINNTATLTFYNVTLKMNCTYTGEYHINVKSQGSFNIFDSDNNYLTTKDASNITNGTTTNNFYFIIDPDAFFTMKNSELHRCGYTAGFDHSKRGLYILSNNTWIENNLFSNNYYAIYLEKCHDNNIINCNFTNNYYGIYLERAVSNNILNSSFFSNTYGIYVTRGEFVLEESSYNNFTNCDISDNTYNLYVYSSNNNNFSNCNIEKGLNNDGIILVRGTVNTFINCSIINCGANGILLHNSNDNNFTKCKVLNNKFTGIALVTSIALYSTNNNIIKDCIISGNSYAVFGSGIDLSSASNNSILNCSISNNNQSGIYLQDNSLENKIENNTIHSNYKGIYLEVNSDAEIHFNKIYNNINYGIQNTDSVILVNATYNWWGESSGPYHPTSNIMGKGDNVSDYVLYAPWLKNPEGNFFPKILTEDNITAIEDIYYGIIYEAIDLNNDLITWSHSSNATWLNWGGTNHTLWGTPTNADVDKYWVCINVTDGRGGYDEHNFTLTVVNVNDNPIINTTNVEITYEDELYEVDYNATDVDSLIDNQIWSLDTNATSWLDVDSNSGIISGTPTNDEVGVFWVNVSVDDGDTGFAYTNYTLIILNVNDRPEIITEDELITNVNILYIVDYNATDIDSLLSQLTWSLNTNATWLDLDTSTGVLSGTPTISDAGWFDVNVTVNDGDGGQDWHDFVLTVTSEGFENGPPEITTIAKISITAGTSYNVLYEAIDDRTPINSLIWSYNSNASWLHFDKITRVLSGSPTLAHVGWYWVNVTVNDGEGGFDSHNFTLTVWATANQPPDILTDNDVNAVVGELYSVDYEAEDDRTPIDKLQWSLATNTSDWLDIDPETGVLSGTPVLIDVGSYWVKVSVFDNENDWDFTNFTLYVTTEPITKFEPKLSNASMTPVSGDTNTEFTFSVDYSHPKGDLPDSIQIVIDGNAFDMESTNGHYKYSSKLSEGNHTYYFTATLDKFTIDTDTYYTGYISKPEDQPEDGDRDDEDNNTLYASIGIIIIIIFAVLILLYLFIKKKVVLEEPAIEEKQLLVEIQPKQPVIFEVSSQVPQVEEKPVQPTSILQVEE